ncbi:hypothetical protein ACFX10_009813 [Malus domestica]
MSVSKTSLSPSVNFIGSSSYIGLEHPGRSFLLCRFVEIEAKSFDREATCCLEQVISENGSVDFIPRLLAAYKCVCDTERRSFSGSERVDLATISRRAENHT